MGRAVREFAVVVLPRAGEYHHAQRCSWVGRAQYASFVHTPSAALRNAARSVAVAWVVHDAEEALAFPATSRLLAGRFGLPGVQVTPRQSLLAIAMIGSLVSTACVRGVRTGGDSRLFRAVVAGLEAHVGTHLVASLVLRRYTAGLVTAPLVMLPGARRVRTALRRNGKPLVAADTARGVALMLSAALCAHFVARTLLPTRPH
jgi:hypothetical protein